MVREDEAARAAGFDGALAGRFLRRPNAGYCHSVWSETVLSYQSPHIGPAGDRLGGAGDFYQPSSELEAEAQAYVLGGKTGSTTPLPNETPEQRRERMLQATMSRLKKEEEELERSCGTTGPS